MRKANKLIQLGLMLSAIALNGLACLGIEPIPAPFDDGRFLYEGDPNSSRGVKICGHLMPQGMEMDALILPESVINENDKADEYGGRYTVTGITRDALTGLKIKKLTASGYYTEFYCPVVADIQELLASGSALGPECFRNTPKLSTVKISTYVLSRYAFKDAQIDQLALNNALKYIGFGVFDNCRIGKLIVTSETPPTASPESFGIYDPSITNAAEAAKTSQLLKDCTLIVPEGCAKKYRKAPGWELFSNIMESSERFNFYEL